MIGQVGLGEPDRVLHYSVEQTMSPQSHLSNIPQKGGHESMGTGVFPCLSSKRLLYSNGGSEV
ncbi:hypothetical protein ES708_06765 [subsurface metagenome]